MSKKFLHIIVFGLCCQLIGFANAKTPLPCADLIAECLTKWQPKQWNNPSKLSKGLTKVCSSLLTKQQMNKWKDALGNCETTARSAYDLHQQKAALCAALVYELHDLAEYKYHDKYCVR